jgi:group II intron reverse transcriptase/maturase
MSPELLKVAERARREPNARFHSLAHLLDVAALRRSYDRLRPSAAVGVDGVDKASYGRTLEANLQDLHRRLRDRRYRHQPILRVYIPKPDGRKRPLGVSALEDKVVQGALREVLEAVYEQDFMDCSYGFRPGRGAHDAIRALSRLAYTGQVRWVLEADIQSFFDSVDHRMLVEILRQRVPDGSLVRLVGKCLKAGVLDGADLSAPGEGTPQGSILSPLMANIYLHHVLDTWFDREVKPRMRGGAHLIRYADDFVICFERKEDSERVQAVLGKRMERFGLRLHPEKTRLVCMERPNREQRSGKGPDTFDLLGFTAHWRRSALYGPLAEERPGALVHGLQDSGQEAPQGEKRHHRVLPPPTAYPGEGAAPRPLAAADRVVSILRYQRQQPQPREVAAPHRAGVAQVAEPPESAQPPQLETLCGYA